MKQAVFWDRDGVLAVILRKRDDGQEWVGCLKLEDFKIDYDAQSVMQEMADFGFLNIVITNQPDIARGNLSQTDLDEMHRLLGEALPIHAIYVCPHDDGQCDCRKPQTGMVIRAAQEHDIDLSRSVFVGDTTSDKGAAEKSGTHFVLRRAQYNLGLDVEHAFLRWSQLPIILKSLLFS